MSELETDAAFRVRIISSAIDYTVAIEVATGKDLDALGAVRGLKRKVRRETAMKDHREIGRLALREEGDEWRAYYALPNTMKEAIFLGCVKLRFVRNETHKKWFMDLMREAVADLIEESTGERPEWKQPREAPFWERRDG